MHEPCPPNFWSAEFSTATPSIDAHTWSRLEEAGRAAYKARVEAHNAHTSTVMSLDKTFSPHGTDAKLKARGFLAQSARAASRLALAVEALEREAAVVRTKAAATEAR